MALPRICPICGPKCSLCCMVFGAWGTIFLAILGIMFYTQSVLLFEDIHYEKEASEFSTSEISERYRSTAFNCWIATGGYVVTMIIAFWQTKWNNHLLL
ncbi:hypothetical protein TTRE_0000014101 [Trichuris trichiura]|uniref:Uncharacterized protein n=1 Tax=Trichuris trichiura TaxID=36087 RepID=A0A077YUV9_TRITR|nr:hypothetical protein TTRE_0000014101 [Trichuris trichiura]